MRARAVLYVSVLSFALGSALLSCQVVAGLTVLEIHDGTGGNGGGSTTGTGGSECTAPSACGADTTCQTFTCTSGTCATVSAAKGKPCTEGGGELCDGKGACVPPSCMDGLKNGEETDVDCGGSCSKCADGLGCLADADCQGGSYCAKSGAAQDPGVCKETKPLGDGCAGGNECGSSFCTDGVCCKTGPCINGCFSCALSGDGVCSPHEGAPCGDSLSDECTGADTCDSLGNCQANDKPVSTPCGDATTNDCTDPDGCDGAGSCKPNHKAAGTSCGDATNDTCTNPDSCDGAGTCLGNHASNGMACGGNCVGEIKYLAGSCNDGQCSAQGVSCPGGYGCNAAQTLCNQSCNVKADCAASTLCVGLMHICVGCGIIPPPPYSCVPGAGGCELCPPDNTCVKICDMPGECGVNKILGGMGMGAPPSRLECNGQCNGILVTCQGPAGCEVVCGNGGCNNLTLNCDPTGPCKLICHGSSCAGATINCGDNLCTAACDAPTAINQVCKQSCGCSKPTCN